MLFGELKKILLQEHIEVVDVSEMHGMICGILIADFSFSFEDWLDEMVYLDYLNPNLIQRDNRLMLKIFFTETAGQLRSGDLNFQMLLPGNEANCRDRVIALSQWCSGFIYGFGIQGKVRDKDLSQNAKTIFAQIAELDSLSTIALNADESSEDEAAYQEVKQFISMEVLLLSDEIQNRSGKQRH